MLYANPYIISNSVKISSKIFTDKGSFRFVFVANISDSDFVKAEISYSALVFSLFGPVQYQIFQIEKL